MANTILGLSPKRPGDNQMKVGDLIRCVYPEDDGLFAIGVVLEVYESPHLLKHRRVLSAIWDDGTVGEVAAHHAEVISESK